jgi:K+-transporting ATPase ATPase A chain
VPLALNAANLAQYALFVIIVTVLVRPVGVYLDRVLAGESTWLDPPLRPLERGIYRLAGVDPQREMTWQEYAAAFVRFAF